MKISYVLCLTTLLFVKLCTSNVFAGDFSELLAEINAVKKHNNVPGLGLAMVNDHKTFYEAYLGHADIDKQVSVTSKTVFRVSSITKTFTSLAILL